MQSADNAYKTNPGESTSDEQPLAAQLIEIAWLVGLFAVPVLFSPNRFFTFYNTRNTLSSTWWG
jgi:hypothetical protein